MVRKLVNMYYKKLGEVTKELESIPTGRLIKRGSFFSQVIDGKKIGVTKNEKRLRQLCRRKYLLFREKVLKKNISILESALASVHEVTDENVIGSFTGAYSEMPIEYFYHPVMEKWLVESQKENLYRKEELTCKSNNGIKLRSKSEGFIANLLEFYNLFYWYEAKLNVKGETIYPDFAIINPYTGKLILWEHFGALHLAGYAEKMVEKMDRYLRLGYVPFETIIYTFEPDALNPDRLRYLIENIVLNRGNKLSEDSL